MSVSAFRLIRAEGLPDALSHYRSLMAAPLERNAPSVFVSMRDAAAVDWTHVPQRILDPIAVKSGPVHMAWIMSPPGKESGGHQNLFRFINFAERAGHRCSIYLYQGDGDPVSIPAIQAMLEESGAYAHVKAPLEFLDRDLGVDSSVEAIFATGWETAYPAYLDKSRAKRFYFIQDFEPSFYSLGSQAVLAENTYRFGFHGITAGSWLAHKVRSDYGMSADHFDFAVDKQHYTVTNEGRRDEVFFYARPVTPRRAFEFGLLVLQDFAALRPDVVINLAGWDVSDWEIPFAYTNHSSVDISDLNGIYNRCAAGLVMSLSNMSLLPLELMSSGVTPVVNDGPNNRMVSDNPYIEYVPTSPAAIARKLVEIMDRPDAIQRSLKMSASVATADWEDSGRQFLTAFERTMRG